MRDVYGLCFEKYKTSKRYIGYTSKNVNIRLSEHNRGCNKWTKNHKPLQLVYREEYHLKSTAIKREKFLKSGFGRRLLDEIVI